MTDPNRHERVPYGDPGRRVAIVAGLRTPFARAGSALKNLTAIELGRIAVTELLERTELDERGVSRARDRLLVEGEPLGFEVWGLCVLVAWHRARIAGAVVSSAPPKRVGRLAQMRIEEWS